MRGSLHAWLPSILDYIRITDDVWGIFGDCCANINETHRKMEALMGKP
jgi:hypothetical protein